MQRFLGRNLLGRTMAFTLSLGLVLACSSSTALAQYKLAKLVSNQSGQAKNTDPLMVNGWGLAYGPGGPFWVSDEGTGWSTIYDGMGNLQALQVVVPAFHTMRKRLAGILFCHQLRYAVNQDVFVKDRCQTLNARRNLYRYCSVLIA